MDLGRLVHHLVHDQADEVAEHDVDDRPKPGHGRAHSKARKSRFRDGRIDHAIGAEFRGKTGEHLERGARFGDIFSQQEDARIAAHFLGDGFADGFPQGYFTLRCCCHSFRHGSPA